ncbi:MAG: EF-hand domain-containing protein [Gemmataceae bacterium]|nr:EF-hand domain-containing protein [Gemmataceae bacterium]
MPHAATRLLVVASLLTLTAPPAHAAEDQDQFEEKTVARCAERIAKANQNERGRWIKDLEAAYPDKVVHALTDDEYATWFALLIGKNEEWKREDCPSPQLAELFDKLVQRLELGPVPSIKRDEFMKYARHVLKEQNPRPGNDPNDEADKVFRVLDRNADGELTPEEFTAGVKEDKLRTDTDNNGRVSKEEYRAYFHRKVAAKADGLAAKSGGDPLAKPGAKGAGGLPDWLAKYDLDRDGQV